MITALRDMFEVRPFEHRPVRLAQEDIPDVDVAAGKVGEPRQPVGKAEVAVIVDRHETRPHERRIGREAHGDRAMRHVEKIRQRRSPHVETCSVAPADEHVVDHRFDDRVGLIEQQDLQDSDVRRRNPGDFGEAPQAPRHQVGSRPSRLRHLAGERLLKPDPAVVGKMGIARIGYPLPMPPAPADDLARFLVVENGGVVGDPGRQIGGGGIAPVEAPRGVREVAEQKAALVRAKHLVSPAMGTVGYLSHPCVSSGRTKGEPAGDGPPPLLSVGRDGRCRRHDAVGGAGRGRDGACSHRPSTTRRVPAVPTPTRGRL